MTKYSKSSLEKLIDSIETKLEDISTDAESGEYDQLTKDHVGAMLKKVLDELESQI